jgi:hypothetical protein
MPYSEGWKQRRKMFHQEFNPTAVLYHRPIEIIAVRTLLKRLLDNKTDFMGHLRQWDIFCSLNLVLKTPQLCRFHYIENGVWNTCQARK